MYRIRKPIMNDGPCGGDGSVIMGRSSWMDKERTDRLYEVEGGSKWEVVNEYQKVPCPHCKELFYCRLTHIFGQPTLPFEYHTNYDVQLENLKELLITYHYQPQYPVKEAQRDGMWILICNEDILGREITE
jgi:hypothetical protein